MEAAVDAIIARKGDESIKALENFINSSRDVFTFPELNSSDRRQDLWNAIFDLAKDAKNNSITSACFSAFKILSRDKTHLNEVVTENLLVFIQRKACLTEDEFVIDDNLKCVIEALKCLCNIVFNSPVALTICYQNGISEGIMKVLKSFRNPKVSEDMRFFTLKLLFLVTALCREKNRKLKDESRGVAILSETLELIVMEVKGESGHNLDNEKNVLSDKQIDIICEILKSLFNLTSTLGNQNILDEEDEIQFKKIGNIIHNLLNIPAKNAEKEFCLINHVINLLYNFPNKFYKLLVAPVENENVPEDLQYEGKDMSAVNKILSFLENKLSDSSSDIHEQTALSPVLFVLMKCAANNREMRKFLRLKILPPLKDVHSRPEEGTKVRNYLCSLMRTPVKQVSDLAAEFLFVLCKYNVSRMIKYTGYGNAAGLFANRGLLGGRRPEEQALYSSDSDSDTEEYKKYKHGINPVTGCFEAPRPDPMANMTEEQKEYEAMKLVKIMDDMLKQGVVKPCRIGEDGRPEPVEHVLQLQEGIRDQQISRDSDDD